MVGFDKGNYNDYDEYIYTVNDLCCEYCHMNFINDLFDNDNIYSVKSNFSFIDKGNVNYTICYNKGFNIINFIKEIGD